VKVLVASANGYGNAGDDICAVVSQELARKAGKQVKVKVTAPPFDESLAEWSDAVMLGGGGIIYDANIENMENYLAYVDYGLKHTKITVGLGLGEQGIISAAGEKRYKAAFNKMDLLTVRSTLDANRLKKFGVKTVEATQDLAFSFDYSHYRKKANKAIARKQKLGNKKPKLGVVLSNQEHLVNDLKLAFSKEEKVNALHFKNSFEKNIEHIADKFDVTIITQSRDDLEMAELYKREYGVKVYSYKKVGDLHKLLKLYAKQDLVLTQRFHGAVFSFMLGIPAIVLGYHGQKQYKLLHDMGIADRLVMYHKPDELESLLHNLSVHSKDLSKKIITLNQKQRNFLISTAKQNEDKLAKVLVT
jgi:polysaccharide pyruvyl transferase WcaK-like protein